MTRLTHVEIGGVDVTSYVKSWTIMETDENPINNATIEFFNTVRGVQTFQTAQLVEIWFGEENATAEKRFAGEMQAPISGGWKTTVKALDKMNRALQTRLDQVKYMSTDSFAGKLSAIFQDVVTTYCGLNADSSSITDSGTSITQDTFVFDRISAKTALDKIAQKLGWTYGYRASDDKVHFGPKQATVNSTILEVGVNVIKVPEWNTSKDEMINDLRVDGTTQESPFVDLFAGDGSTKVFTLTKTPLNVTGLYYSAAKNYATTAPLPAELKVLGVVDSSTGSYDYTIDKASRKLETVFTPASNGGLSNIYVAYTYARPTAVHTQDDISIEDKDVHATAIETSENTTVNDVSTTSDQIISKFARDFIYATVSVPVSVYNNFVVGQSIQCVDTISNPAVNEFLNIYGVKLSYGGSFDELLVGDRPASTPEMLMTLSDKTQETDYTDDTLLIERRSTPLPPIVLDITSGVGVTKLVNDSFSVDHDVNGIIYNENETAIIDDFETAATWAQDSGSIALTETNDSTAGHFWIGTQGLNYAWTGSGTGKIVASGLSYDLSNVTGSSSGNAVQGTAGMWIYQPTGGTISEVRLRIGSSASDYTEHVAQTYQQKVDGTGSFTTVAATRTYILFDLDNPDGGNGTPDWTAADYFQIAFDVTGTDSVTFDYFTVSKSNVIALNGLGDRSTVLSTTTDTI